MSEPGIDDGRVHEGPSPQKVVRATIALEPGEPLRGSLTPVGVSRPQPFTGWLEFASALEALRGAEAGPSLPLEREQEKAKQGKASEG